MANINTNQKEEESHIPLQQEEKAILYQIAKMLVREKWINPEEQLRFLELVKEGT